MYTYTPDIVAYLLERRFNQPDSLDDVEYFVDLDAGMAQLQAQAPTSYRLVRLYAIGMGEEELAVRFALSPRTCSLALELIFQTLARLMNGEL